jgi:hypothetical protein
VQQGCYALIVTRGKWERVEGVARHVVSPEKNPNFRSHTSVLLQTLGFSFFFFFLLHLLFFFSGVPGTKPYRSTAQNLWGGGGAARRPSRSTVQYVHLAPVVLACARSNIFFSLAKRTASGCCVLAGGLLFFFETLLLLLLLRGGRLLL